MASRSAPPSASRPPRSRVTTVFMIVYAAVWAGLLVRWPGVWTGNLAWLGLPRSLWWVIFLLASIFVALLVIFRQDRDRHDS